MIKPSLHILLIEDNEEDLADLRQMLLMGGSRSYRFSEAKLGAEGLKMILNIYPSEGQLVRNRVQDPQRLSGVGNNSSDPQYHNA